MEKRFSQTEIVDRCLQRRMVLNFVGTFLAAVEHFADVIALDVCWQEGQPLPSKNPSKLN